MYIELSRLINITLLLWGAFFSFIIALNLVLSKVYQTNEKKWLIVLELVIAILLLNDAMSWYFLKLEGSGVYNILNTVNFLVFLFTDIALFVFQQYIKCRIYLKENERDIKITIASIISIVAMVLVCLNPFTHMYYYIDSTNTYFRGDGYIISVILTFACMIIDMITLYQYRKRFKRSIWLATFSFLALPLLAALIQVNVYGLSLINFAIAISVMLMFITTSREQDTLLANAIRSNEQTNEKLEIASTLNQCVRELSKTENESLAINNLLKIINDYFNSDRSYLFKIDYDNDVLHNRYEYCAPNVTPQIDNLQNIPLEVISTWMPYFKKGEPYLMKSMDDEKGTPSYDVLDGQEIFCLLAVPIMQNDEVTGFLGVDNPRVHSEDPTLLSAIQFFIIKAIDRKNEKEYLQYLSYRDNLTGLFNRNRYIQLLEESKGIALKNTGVAWIDINGLKEVNDSKGHYAGDLLIKDVTNIINMIFTDKSYRTGGDEFAIVSIGISKDSFSKQINNLKQAFNDKNISCSIGYVYEEEVSNLEETMKQADTIMYQQKQKYYQSIQN